VFDSYSYSNKKLHTCIWFFVLVFSLALAHLLAFAHALALTLSLALADLTLVLADLTLALSLPFFLSLFSLSFHYLSTFSSFFRSSALYLDHFHQRHAHSTLSTPPVASHTPRHLHQWQRRWRHRLHRHQRLRERPHYPAVLTTLQCRSTVLKPTPSPSRTTRMPRRCAGPWRHPCHCC
jgi:hypothetical protein